VIEFPGGSSHECDIDSATLAREVIEAMAFKLNCQAHSPFSLSLSLSISNADIDRK
jgi:hypothetical protein